LGGLISKNAGTDAEQAKPARRGQSRADSWEEAMNWMPAIIVLIALFAGAPSTARANNQAVTNCDSEDPNRAIPGCTELLVRRLTEFMRARVHNNRGKAYNQKGEYDRAIKDLSQAIQLDPTLAVAYSNRGNAYSSKRALDRAIADFSKAIRFDRKESDGYYGRGNAYGLKRQYDRAIVDFSEAIRLNPRNRDAYYNRGASYKAIKKFRDALADYRKCLELTPGAADATGAIVRIKKKM
jgi:tetratricopeptide (TPR) repeat protein